MTNAETPRGARLLPLLLGPAIALALLSVEPMGGMSVPAWRTAAVGAWMALWWVTEAVPIPATALLPIALFPLLGIANVTAAAAPYANPIIYLFFGGFILGLAFEHSNLHRRLAFTLLAAVGSRPDRIVLGFMITGAFISMWVSNTATVLMLYPLITSIIAASPHEESAHGAGAPTNFERALLLGLAYSATIGGFGTLIGTPPNALLSGFLNQQGVRLGFLDYMMVGVPIVVLSVPITWLLLTRVVFRVDGRGEHTAGANALVEQRRALGPWKRAEKFVAVVAIVTAVAWMTQPLLSRTVPGLSGLSEAGISVLAAAVLLIVPIDRQGTRVVGWQAAESIPWGVLILFGGGLSLAAAIQDSGLAAWIGNSVGELRAVPPLVVVLVITTVITLLTEFTSNAATAAAFLPVAWSLAGGVGMSPVLLAITAGLAASNGFMLPVGTPPNAIIFASGRLTIREMARAGLLVDLLFIVLITAVAYFVALPVLT